MKISLLFVFIFLSVHTSFSNENNSSWNEAITNGNGHVTIYYYDSDHFISSSGGKLSGIEYDLFLEFFKFLSDSLNIKIKYEFVKASSFGNLYNEIKNGGAGIFGACSFSITEKRLSEVQFSPRYMPDIEVLISSQNLPISSDTAEFIKTLGKAKALSVSNTTFENNIYSLKKILPSLQIENVKYASIIRDRISKEPDLISYIELPNYFVSISKGIRLKRHTLFKVERKGYAIIYPKNSDWTEIIEMVFNSYDFKMKANQIIKKHLGEDVNDLLWNIASEKEFMKNKEILLLTKEREIQNLEIEKKELQITKQNFLKNVLIAGVIIVFAVLLLIYNRYRIKQKTAKIIEDKNKELEKLSIVVSKTDNAVIIASPDGTIEWVNDSLKKMHSKKISSPESIYGKNFISLSSNPEMKNLVELCKKHKNSVSYESESTNSDGQNFWVQSTLTPILDETGNVSKFVIIDSDITRRKHAEEIIREKNKDITDSINYALRIQQALLPDRQKLTTLLQESFVLYKPRDIVSGDFYFAETIRMNNGTTLTGFAVGDCTGHGVPGAFMSMIGTSFLKQSLSEKTVNNPAEALDFVSKKNK